MTTGLNWTNDSSFYLSGGTQIIKRDHNFYLMKHFWMTFLSSFHNRTGMSSKYRIAFLVEKGVRCIISCLLPQWKI